MKLHYWILAVLAALLLLANVANAQPHKTKLIEDPAAWVAQHGHRKLGKFASNMMKIDFNISMDRKGKRR